MDTNHIRDMSIKMSIKLEMIKGETLSFDFNSYEDFIIFLQKNRIMGEWKLNLK